MPKLNWCVISRRVRPSLAGPGFTLALIPYSCQIFPANKTLACAPAQIVLAQDARRVLAGMHCTLYRVAAGT